MGIKVVGSNLVHQIPVKQVDSGGGGGSSITVDSELSLSSKNPVQNKVITEALNGLDKIFAITITVSNDSTVWTMQTKAGEIANAIKAKKFCVCFIEYDDVDYDYWAIGYITQYSLLENGYNFNVLGLDMPGGEMVLMECQTADDYPRIQFDG